MEIKILNLNFWLLPFNFSMENNKRLLKFFELIKNLNPDIITLQEVWLNKYVNLIKKSLKEYQIITQKKRFFNKTGLMTLTKIKPSSCYTKFFPLTNKHNFIEKVARKGYQKINFEINNKKFSIINTHLYAPKILRMKKINFNQFLTLKKITKNGNFLVFGDLNINLDNFNILNKDHFKITTKKEYSISLLNKYFMLKKEKGKNNSKIDYALKRITTNKKFSLKSKTLEFPELSDHYAIFSRLKI